MNQKEKVAKLLTQNSDGEIRTTEITQEQLDRIFFGEGDRKWDNIHTCMPEPVWGRFYEDGYLLYEGFTVDDKAFGAGRAYYEDGKVMAEGIFGLKGMLSGREYYPNGRIRFEGLYRLNQGYGPNFPDFGTWFAEDGKQLFHGKLKVSRSSLGWPHVEEPKGMTWFKHSPVKGHIFSWEDARKWMRLYVAESMMKETKTERETGSVPGEERKQ